MAARPGRKSKKFSESIRLIVFDHIHLIYRVFVLNIIDKIYDSSKFSYARIYFR